MTPKRTVPCLRLLAVTLSLLFVGALVAVDGTRMLPLLIIPAVILLAGLLGSWRGSPPAPPDASDGGGGTPLNPRIPPRLPNGRLPLPDAGQSGRRLRDHRRPAWTCRRERRPARERSPRPAREPARIRGGAQTRTTPAV